MKDITNTEEFIKEYAEHSRLSQKDVQYMLKTLGTFFEEVIENQCTIKTSVFELSYKEIKGRETKLFGKLPPSREVSLKLANKYRMKQKEQNKVYRSLLEKTETEETLTKLE